MGFQNWIKTPAADTAMRAAYPSAYAPGATIKRNEQGEMQIVPAASEEGSSSAQPARRGRGRNNNTTTDNKKTKGKGKNAAVVAPAPAPGAAPEAREITGPQTRTMTERSAPAAKLDCDVAKDSGTCISHEFSHCGWHAPSNKCLPIEEQRRLSAADELARLKKLCDDGEYGIWVNNACSRADYDACSFPNKWDRASKKCVPLSDAEKRAECQKNFPNEIDACVADIETFAKRHKEERGASDRIKEDCFRAGYRGEEQDACVAAGGSKAYKKSTRTPVEVDANSTLRLAAGATGAAAAFVSISTAGSAEDNLKRFRDSLSIAQRKLAEVQ